VMEPVTKLYSGEASAIPFAYVQLIGVPSEL